MNRGITLLVATLLSAVALAHPHGSPKDEVRAAVEDFNNAYATNDVETYFGYYADAATVYFFGARQDMAAYHEEWSAMMEAGGGVEVNDISDLVVQVMPGNRIAIATYFVDNRTRSPDGEVSTSRAFETDVWRRFNDGWMIVSLHYSVIPAE